MPNLDYFAFAHKTAAGRRKQGNPKKKLPEERPRQMVVGHDIELWRGLVCVRAPALEMAQANLQFALESGPRLASVRSPVELLRVLEELTKERIAMFRKYSNEMVRLSMPR